MPCWGVLLQAFVAPLPVRALPGVGYKADGLLKSWGVTTAADARSISKQQLIKGLGEKPGEPAPGCKGGVGVPYGALSSAAVSAPLHLLQPCCCDSTLGIYQVLIVVTRSLREGRCRLASQGLAEL